MSTFSGLGTALSSLIAQRQGLEVAGQNIANANTVGYTRQRATLSSLPASTVPSMFATSSGVGQGVMTSGFDRLGDVFIDARLRTQTSGAGYLKQVASSYAELEATVGEPSKTGLSTAMTTMWAAWSDVAKNTGSTTGEAARSVLLQRSTAVADGITTLYNNVATQWQQALTTTGALVTQVNTTASNLADLNDRILSITNSGGSANELMDQRDQLITQLSGLVGASTRVQENGTVDVMVAGNALVSGSKANVLEVRTTDPSSPGAGAATFAQAVAGGSVQVVWAGSKAPAGLDGGRVAGLLTVLAPPATDGSGGGGMLTEAARSFDALAVNLATRVNTLYAGGAADPATAPPFFTYDPTRPAASLAVAVTKPADLVVADPTKGPLDGSVADRIAKLAVATDGPDSAWSATVVQLGVRSASAASRATVAEAARATAASQQLAQTSVDTDEESVNMLAYQRAYEGAARVMTAIDEMLDTLINRTGVVGR